LTVEKNNVAIVIPIATIPTVIPVSETSSSLVIFQITKSTILTTAAINIAITDNHIFK